MIGQLCKNERQSSLLILLSLAVCGLTMAAVGRADPLGVHGGLLMLSAIAGIKAKRNDVQIAFCWSHVRRRFYELAAAGPAPIATEALERIAELYAVEKDIRGRNADERRVVRQDRSRPIIDHLEPWLRGKLALISQKTKLAEAIRYALSRWNVLTYFLDDGRIEIGGLWKRAFGRAAAG